MASFENVEKLRERANVTYDEAKIALDTCDDDLLEAIIYLEKQGKVTAPCGGGYYSSREQAEQQKRQNVTEPKQPKGESFSMMMGRFFRWIRNLFVKGNTNMFHVYRNNDVMLTMPVTVLLLLLIFCFWIIVPLVVIGLFFGCSYRFHGEDMEKTGANRVMQAAENAAVSLKKDIEDSHPEEPEQQ